MSDDRDAGLSWLAVLGIMFLWGSLTILAYEAKRSSERLDAIEKAIAAKEAK